MAKSQEEGLDIYKENWENLTRDKAFEGYLPEQVCISLQLMDGSMGDAIVCPGEHVSKGQIIGKSTKEEDFYIYSSITGRVTDIFYIQRAPGIQEPFIKIKKEQKRKQGKYPVFFDVEKENILHWMRQIGIEYNYGFKVNQIVVNGFANEPYITSGYRLIMESPGKIILGAILSAEVVEADKIILYINENALDAIMRLKRSIEKYGKCRKNRCPIQIVTIKHRYPAGNEQIIKRIFSKKGSGCSMVVSLEQMAALYDAIYDGEPWIKVGVTVSGKVEQPKNLWVPIGTNVKELIDYCGGRSNGFIIFGGPFAGRTTSGENCWVTQTTTGILVIERKNPLYVPCIRCGLCREACPQKLKPDCIEKQYMTGKESFHGLNVEKCIQCGLCSYVCPSGRRLTEYIGQVKKGRVKRNKNTDQLKGKYIDLSMRRKYEKYIQTFEVKSQSPPHIHQRGTIQNVMYNSIFGLVPLILGVLFKYREQWTYILCMLFVGSISAVLTEYFFQKISGQYDTIKDGSAVFTGLLLPLLFKPETSLLRVCLSAGFVILFGKQLFGGIGHAPVHPVILGKLLFQPVSVPMVEPLWYLALFSWIWMTIRKMQPVTYALVFLVFTGGLKSVLLKSSLLYLAAAYFIWSYETMPPTKSYRWIFTLCVTVLSVVFYETGLKSLGICFAVGIADTFVPWMREQYEKSM